MAPGYPDGGAPNRDNAAIVDATVTVVHDACAAPNLEFGGEGISGKTAHGAFMAALADGYATVVSGGDL
jgi:hypothetical protein